MENTKQLLIQIDEAQLKRFINVSVRAIFEDLFEDHVKNKIETPVNAKECARLFGYSNPKVMIEKHKRGEVRAYKWSGERSHYLFYLSEVNEDLRNSNKNYKKLA